MRSGLTYDFYVFYYPALLGFSLMLPKRASLPLASLVMGLYALNEFVAGLGLGLETEDEKTFVVRLACMLSIVGAGDLITSWERARHWETMAAERQRSNETLALQHQAQQPSSRP